MWTGLSAAAVGICREPAKHWRNPFSASLYTRWRRPRLREFSANQRLCHVFLVPSSPSNTKQRWSMRSCSSSIVCGGGGRFSLHLLSSLRTCSGESHVLIIRRYGDLQFQSKQKFELWNTESVALSLSTCRKSNTMSDWINTDSANFCRLRHTFISFSLF